jgi:hypothetical protein
MISHITDIMLAFEATMPGGGSMALDPAYACKKIAMDSHKCVAFLRIAQ